MLVDRDLVSHILIILFIVMQIVYLLTFLVDAYLFTRPVNIVDMKRVPSLDRGNLPPVVLFYPVLRELEETMRTTLTSLAALDYPPDRRRVIAVPNADDRDTVASLRRLQRDFPFLEMLEVPPTSDPSWQTVWRAWDNNLNAHWWHQGVRARDADLPPKKTRQLIYAFYRTVDEAPGSDFLVNYIDADSCPPRDHFLAGALGMQDYDVLQSTNIAGNLNASMAASWHAFDHMTWDGRKYAHLSADGRHPYWVLGKGLFFRASDLLTLGSFHPWITIEDPEVGMRFWANGKRLGIIEAPLIEEVPVTLARGIRQRKRWVCGFYQSLSLPTTRALGLTAGQRLKAWMNFFPCLSLWVNALGLPTGLWALITFIDHRGPLPEWTLWLSAFNVAALVLSLVTLYWSTWKRTALVLDRRRDRLWYMIRVNPVSLMIWWLIWLIPLAIGWRMYRRDQGLVWDRTEKIDANAALVRTHIVRPDRTRGAPV